MQSCLALQYFQYYFTIIFMDFSYKTMKKAPPNDHGMNGFGTNGDAKVKK